MKNKITLKNVNELLTILDKANAVYFRGDALFVYDRDDVYAKYEFKDGTLEDLVYSKYILTTNDFKVSDRFFIKPFQTKIISFNILSEGQLVINVGMFAAEVINIKTREGKSLLKKWREILSTTDNLDALDLLLTCSQRKTENFAKLVSTVKGE